MAVAKKSKSSLSHKQKIRFTKIFLLIIIILVLTTIPLIAFKINQETVETRSNATLIDEENANTPDSFNTLCETRATWLNPEAFDTSGSRQSTLQKLNEANFNTIFLAAYTLNGNYGNLDDKNGVPKEKLFENMLDEAKNAGFSVHVWLDSMRRKYPEGQPECDKPKCIVNYTDKKEQETHEKWCLDWLTKYPNLSGINFDNVRFQNPLDHIDKNRLDGLNDTLQACSTAVKKQFPGKYVTAFGGNVDPKLIKSDDFLPQWFKNWQNTHADDSVFFYNGNKYRPDGLQPINWLKSGTIAAYAPGDFTTSLKLWQIRLPEWKSLLSLPRLYRRLIFGLAWLPSKGTITYPDGSTYKEGGYNAKSIADQIEYTRSSTPPANGFVVFQIGKKEANDAPLINTLKNGPFQQPAISCIR